jgi:hypothetical protein
MIVHEPASVFSVPGAPHHYAPLYHKKTFYLLDSAPDEHTIVFAQGEMIAIICPSQKSDTRESPSVTNSAKRRRVRGRSD